MINNCEFSSERLFNTDLVKNKINEEDLGLKLKQIKEVTYCTEEQGILYLHDCNYNVELAINKILTLDAQTGSEWKTKKGRQRKVALKTKDTDKNEFNNNIDDSIISLNDKDEKQNASTEVQAIKLLNQDSCSNGKTFRNFNLSKGIATEYSMPENVNNRIKLSTIDLNCTWEGKSVIIENHNFKPMSSSDVSFIVEGKMKSAEKQTLATNDSVSKADLNTDSSIMFKTHCSTKPPPKVQYSLAAPVQIMNKNTKHRALPKFKFGDTDFYEETPVSVPESAVKSESPDNGTTFKPTVINVEDNSIIKVGPSQKLSGDQPSPNFEIEVNSYVTQRNVAQAGNMKIANDYSKFNSGESYYENYGYINLQNQLPIGNPLSCTGFQPLNSYIPANMNIMKDIGNHASNHDLYVNQAQSAQSNINLPKSTVMMMMPHLMMNPMNTMYMTVANPLPNSVLSPQMAIPSQFNASQHNKMYFDESHQGEDAANRANRQYNVNRQQPGNRRKKPCGDMPDDLSLKGDPAMGGYKGPPRLPMGTNPLSTQVPMNYSVYISPVTAPNRAQLIPNAVNHFSHPFHPQELGNFDDNRKRNIQIPANNINRKSWQ